MKIRIKNVFKIIVCSFLAIFMLVSLFACGNTQNTSNTTDAIETTDGSDDEGLFIKLENWNFLSPWGDEYTILAREPELYNVGELVFEGAVKGVLQSDYDEELGCKDGLYSIKNDEAKNVLVLVQPDSEWFIIYRKTTLPDFDISVDNCVRLELTDVDYKPLGVGITDKAEIAAFLADVRSQPNPHEAGLYDLVRKPEGGLENCHSIGYMCGFFEEEPCVAVNMIVMTYNDLAYSIYMPDGEHHVLPNEWFERLTAETNI